MTTPGKELNFERTTTPNDRLTRRSRYEALVSKYEAAASVVRTHADTDVQLQPQDQPIAEEEPAEPHSGGGHHHGGGGGTTPGMLLQRHGSGAAVQHHHGVLHHHASAAAASSPWYGMTSDGPGAAPPGPEGVEPSPFHRPSRRSINGGAGGGGGAAASALSPVNTLGRRGSAAAAAISMVAATSGGAAGAGDVEIGRLHSNGAGASIRTLQEEGYLHGLEEEEGDHRGSGGNGGYPHRCSSGGGGGGGGVGGLAAGLTGALGGLASLARYAAIDALLPPLLLRQLRLFASMPRLRCCFCKQAMHAPVDMQQRPPKPAPPPVAGQGAAAAAAAQLRAHTQPPPPPPPPHISCGHCGRSFWRLLGAPAGTTTRPKVAAAGLRPVKRAAGSAGAPSGGGAVREDAAAPGGGGGDAASGMAQLLGSGGKKLQRQFVQGQREAQEQREAQGQGGAQQPGGQRHRRLFPVDEEALAAGEGREAEGERTAAQLERATRHLEDEAYPTTEELTRKVTAANLEKARRIKNRLVRLTKNVQSVREVLERFLNDDDDMHRLHLTGAELSRQVSLRQGDLGRLSASMLPGGATSAADSDSSSDSSIDEAETAAVEMLLEAYFMMIDHTFNRLQDFGAELSAAMQAQDHEEAILSDAAITLHRLSGAEHPAGGGDGGGDVSVKGRSYVGLSGGATQSTAAAAAGYSSLQLPFELKVLEVCLDMEGRLAGTVASASSG
ncbi:Magnesium transporter MRS2-10 [Tetrabaena socialis]|uniref:Magnesium transporter MRS2-10 n=1 Tax=Tetrabaena socialis TaxID=47790 RepID=A0A2J8A591_9CHLO|nr:Magnesium transporter MRS2-10 [Tetrabaena socialis]|eukprot:PNH07686.1 Magnesium transporter MRS2-10 [Tetrabaena socialis]